MPISEPVALAEGYGVLTGKPLVTCLSLKPEMGGCLLTCKKCGFIRSSVLLLQKGVKDAGQAKATNINLSNL